MLQAPAVPSDADARAQQEAERLADEVLAAPEGSVPFDVRAQALAVKGLYTRALVTYVEGLRPYVPRSLADGLLRIIRSHPALKQPESLLAVNPLEAERHYAAGLNFFFRRDYANAEKDFLLAIENDNQDARYFYFLGLSRLMQGKRRQAYEDFDMGSRLERLNRPAPAAVSSSLERVQGPVRRVVNEARNRPQ
jgi:tetratricopeptide (TPR) repeat protein